MASSLRDKISEMALQVGFDEFGITNASLDGEVGERLREFVGQGFHGQMTWFADRINQRASPDALWPDCKSVIMLTMNYGPDHDPLPELEEKEHGVISVYARHKDYHDIVKKRLKQFGRWLVEETSCEIKVFVDTAPVAEKPLAAAAGLGWQGKHTNLVSRTHGSWLFLGAIYTTLDLDADQPETDHCGSCQSCLDICPTNAFPSPYQLDARRCISYLTIEHKGLIPREFRKDIGNRIYGCDDCLAVCPWNKFAAAASEIGLIPRDDLTLPLLADLVQLKDTEFRAKFSGSPIKRIKRDNFIRNVLVAIGNSGSSNLVEYVVPLLEDDAAVVRGMAVWALNELAPSRALELQSQYLAKEKEADVIAEWQAL